MVGLLFLRWSPSAGDAGPGGAHLLLMATRWAWLWVAATAAWIAFTLSELTGLPVGELPAHPDRAAAVSGTDRILAEFATLWVALAIALFGARLSGAGRHRRCAAGRHGGAAAQRADRSRRTPRLPHHRGAQPRRAPGGCRDLGRWPARAGRPPAAVPRTTPAARCRRFSTAALLCVLAVGLSGVVESVVMLRTWTALWDTNRGHLIIAKTLALAVLASIGYAPPAAHRRPGRHRRLAPLLRLAAGELALMGATVGIAVVLSTTG